VAWPAPAADDAEPYPAHPLLPAFFQEAAASLSWLASRFSPVEPDAFPPRNVDLKGREVERDTLEGVLTAIQAGQSRVLVMHGEPGVGKTALLDYVADGAAGCRVIRAGGVESNMELAYAALHQLCAPMLDRLDHLPPPQRDALGTAFGLSSGPAPDRFLIGLAVLSMFAGAAEEQPLVCLIDDLQWLDRASAQALAFAAGRLVAESVGMILATRVPNADLRALPEMHIRGLRSADARDLLDAALTTPLDERIRDRIVAETRGNPLALLEIPHGLGVRDLAGGFGLPTARLSTVMEQNFRRAAEALPEQTRRLLLLAAAEPIGDPVLLLRAAAQLGIGADAAAPAVSDELVEFGPRVRFRHPLVRSAIYRSAPIEAKHMVHQALAEATDPDSDPDRRAWHRAQATEGPDEDVAALLERSAGRARARGGMAAAAAFLERAAMLTLDRSQRAERALAAASAHLDAGAFDATRNLLAMAKCGPLNDYQEARVDLLRAQLAFVTGRGNDAPALLLKAAKRLESIDTSLSRATYLDALTAGIFAGDLAVGGGVDVARAAQKSPRPSVLRLPDLLLDALATYVTGGYVVALPILRRVIGAALCEESPDEQLRYLFQTSVAAFRIWDDESWEALSARNVELARAAGALTELPLALSSRGLSQVLAGELTAAESLIQEQQTVSEAIGSRFNVSLMVIVLAAFRGDEMPVTQLTKTTVKDARARGEGGPLTVVPWANAVLNNGLGRYGDAVAAAQGAVEQPTIGDLSHWAQAELVEAATRSGLTRAAKDALNRLSQMTSASGTDWALGIEARSRALVSDGAEAERLYREAIERLGRTRIRTELARAHLLYGEWLRRQRRRAEARAQLRTAQDMFDAMGLDGFAERTRRELGATGETASGHNAVARGDHLTAQEAQIARMAREGLSNSEIATRLFISAKTVQYHLTKVFAKLGIISRFQLNDAFPTDRRGP
jgi:DNA-binding CsgD family transcriptional regulator